MKNISIITLLFSLLLASCVGDSFVGGKHQENLKRLDKIHGYCDNPARTDIAKKGIAYDICKDHERALGPDGDMDEMFSLGKSFDGLFDKNSQHTNTISARYYKDGSEVLISRGKNKNPRKQGGGYSRKKHKKKRKKTRKQYNNKYRKMKRNK